MTTQAGLFDAPQPAAPAVEMADGAAMARLRMLCGWAAHSSPCGWSMRQAWTATAPWQSMDDARKASNAASAKLQRSKSWAGMSGAMRFAALGALEPFTVYTYRRERATQTIMCAIAGAHLSLADAAESARGIAAMCAAPAEVVVRYVLTGEVTL